MGKIKNAFALRGLYDALLSVVEEEILPSYDERASCSLNRMEYWDNGDGRFEIRLRSYVDRNRTDIIGLTKSALESLEKELEECRTRQKNLTVESERISAHVKKLQDCERRLFEKVLSQGLNADRQEKGTRLKDLIRKYDWLNRLLFDYGVLLMKDEKILEENFKSECRKLFGARLRQARLAKKHTTETIAKEIGITKTGYGFYELGYRDLPTPTIYRLAKILDVSTDWLFGLK